MQFEKNSRVAGDKNEGGALFCEHNCVSVKEFYVRQITIFPFKNMNNRCEAFKREKSTLCVPLNLIKEKIQNKI